MRGSKLLAPLGWPIRDVIAGLEECLAVGGSAGLGWIGAGLVIGWWAYVPIHELLHAAGCVLAGGTVTTLQIAPLYGGAFYEWVFPFVEADGPYAGRLSDFDWHGNEFIYFVTDVAPYTLTVFPGVWLLRQAGRNAQSFVFGATIVVALAPFVSIFGDAYEIGTVVLNSLPAVLRPEHAETVRSDDLFLLISRSSPAHYPTIFAAFTIGSLWAFATYGLGVGVQTALRR